MPLALYEQWNQAFRRVFEEERPLSIQFEVEPRHSAVRVLPAGAGGGWNDCSRAGGYAKVDMGVPSNEKDGTTRSYALALGEAEQAVAEEPVAPLEISEQTEI